MKNWREVKNKFLNVLTPVLGEKESHSVFRLTIEKFTGNFPPTAEDLNSQLSEVEIEKVNDILSRLQNNEPIQYILGYAWFYDLKLRVTKDVLIPRQETEELVHWISSEKKSTQRYQILDLGCGSGAIGLALAKYLPNSQVIAGDISTEAVQIAKQNAKWNNITNISFSELDMLALPEFSKRFDIIVSNPPYVDWDHQKKMPENVTKYEPELAIFAPKGDELRFFKSIADFARKQLKDKGQLFFEINEHYKDEVVQMLYDKGFKTVEPKKDLNGNWRMVKAEIITFINQ